MSSEIFTLRDSIQDDEEKSNERFPNTLISFQKNSGDILETPQNPYELFEKESKLKEINDKDYNFVKKVKIQTNKTFENKFINSPMNVSSQKNLPNKINTCNNDQKVTHINNLSFKSYLVENFNEQKSNKCENLNKTFNSKGNKFIFEKETVEDIMSMNFFKSMRGSKKNFIKISKFKPMSSTPSGFSKRPYSAEVSRVSNLEKIYHRGMEMRERSKRNLLSLKNSYLKMEMKECTFSPKINDKHFFINLKKNYTGSKSKNNLKSRSNLNSEFQSGTDLNKISNRSKANLTHSQFRSNREKSEPNETMNLFSNRFHTQTDFPKAKKSYTSKNLKYISKSVDKLSVNSTKTLKTEEQINKYSEKLFNDAERYRYNKEKLATEYLTTQYPFHPTISDKNKPNIYNFFYRLQKWVDRRNEKYEYDLEKANYDTKTGLRLFSPTINEYSYKHFGLNERDKSKCLSLYNEWKQRKMKEFDSQERLDQHVYYLSNIAHTDTKSQEINNELLRKIFTKIYELLLDGVDSNVITGNNYNSKNLPVKIANLICRLLRELKEQNETLTLDEFILACDQIYSYLPYDEKKIFTEWYFSDIRRKGEDKNAVQHTFKPSLDKNSLKIANSSKKYASSIYLRAVEKLQKKNQETTQDTSEIYKNKISKSNTSYSSRINKFDGIRSSPNVNNIFFKSKTSRGGMYNSNKL